MWVLLANCLFICLTLFGVKYSANSRALFVGSLWTGCLSATNMLGRIFRQTICGSHLYLLMCGCVCVYVWTFLLLALCSAEKGFAYLLALNCQQCWTGWHFGATKEGFIAFSSMNMMNIHTYVCSLELGIVD